MSFERSSKRLPAYRWLICGMLLLATTSNYMDRQVLGILAPDLQRELGWTEVEYGNIVTAFQAAYALGLLGCGWLIDRVGARWGLMLAVSLWSLSSAMHGFARSATSFALARFSLGLAEAGNFPASVKSVAEWFPKSERAFAIGIFNSGSNLGAILAPLLVPFIALQYGWQSAFYILGGLGVLWVVLAAFLLRSPRVDEVALYPHEVDHVSKKVTWVQALGRCDTWGFALAKFLTDPVWWFYLYWTPKYLNTTFGVQLSGIGTSLVVIYLCADIGSIGGGWWSGRLMRRGVPVAKARMVVLFWCAVAAIPVMALAYASQMWQAVALLGLATAAHQAWSANLFASVTDSVPEGGVATVVGIGGMSGAVGGMILAQVAGHTLQLTGSYMPLFIVCCSMYLAAWSVLVLRAARG
jgi:ACS family hexuronate transporter-like MFS transporter